MALLNSALCLHCSFVHAGILVEKSIGMSFIQMEAIAKSLGLPHFLRKDLPTSLVFLLDSTFMMENFNLRVVYETIFR